MEWRNFFNTSHHQPRSKDYTTTHMVSLFQVQIRARMVSTPCVYRDPAKMLVGREHLFIPSYAVINHELICIPVYLCITNHGTL